VAAAVAVAPVESAIAGKRLTLIEQAKGCHESMAPFCFCAQIPFRDVPCVGRGLSRCEMLCAVRGGTVRDGRPATRREMQNVPVFFPSQGTCSGAVSFPGLMVELRLV
jgi:hypothetical protein